MTPRVYFDSNILIELCERDVKTPTELVRLFQSFEARPLAGVTSRLTLGESLGRQAPHMNWEEQKALYQSFLCRGGFIDVVAIDDPILFHSADLRHQARFSGRSLRLADAIHVASASIALCEFFLTADIRLAKGLPPNLRSIAPSPDGLATLIRALDA